MQKPKSLRQAIENALPEIAENPDKLAMFVQQGYISSNKGTLSHTKNYTLTLLITDFTSDLDILETVIVHWLQTNQPDILGAGQTERDSFKFDVDILSHDSADVLYQLKLSERVVALHDEETAQIHITHAPEPQHIQDLTGILGEMWGKSEDWQPEKWMKH